MRALAISLVVVVAAEGAARAGAGAAPATAPGQRRLEALWAELPAPDEAKANDAVLQMARVGGPAIRYLAGRLRPVRIDLGRARELVALLDHPSYRVRQQAHAELAAAEEAALPALREALRGQLTPEQQDRVGCLVGRGAEGPPDRPAARRNRRAILVLEILWRDEARKVLRSLAGGDPAAATTRRAREALGRLKTQARPIAPEVRVAVAELAGRESRAHLRAVNRLRRFGGRAEPAAAALVGVLRGRWYPHDRQGVEAAKEALALLQQIGEPAVDPLIAALKDEDAATRAGAAMALGLFRSARAAGPLVEALPDRQGIVTAEVVKALGAHDRDRVVALLIEGVKAGNWGAAGALSTFPDARAVPFLLEALGSKEPAMRRNAAMALGAQKARRAVRPLIAMLAREDEHIAVQQCVISALTRIGDRAAVEPLLGVLKTSKSSGILVWAIAALRELGDQRAVDPIIAALKAPQPNVRNYAAAALGHLKDRKALAPLLAALNDDTPDVQMSVASALAALGDRRAVPHLIARLRSPHPFVRNNVVIALGRLGDKRAVGPLIESWPVTFVGVPVGAEGLGAEGPGQAYAVALRSLTGEDFGAVREVWRGWWKKQKDLKPPQTRPAAPKR